ncbi:unnamed protein product [Peniophora sp. CBMAI 1063]|nr:unnamed protein product [Peniophora sp. CBMAI 1063]
MAESSSSQTYDAENARNVLVPAVGQQSGPGSQSIDSRHFSSRSQPTKAPAPAPPLKRSATTIAAGPQPPKRARGEEGSFNTRMRGVLDKFEDDMTCPICFDIIALAYLTNPCGHSTCGDCLASWIDAAKLPTCPLCREVIDANAPLIPNFSLDNMLEKHVCALSDSGAKDWAPGGSKFEEWTARKAACRANMAKRRAAKSTAKKAVQREETELTVGGDDPEDEDYEGSDGTGSDGEQALEGSGSDESEEDSAEETEAEEAAPGPSTRGRNGQRGRGRGRGRGHGRRRRGRRFAREFASRASLRLLISPPSRMIISLPSRHDHDFLTTATSATFATTMSWVVNDTFTPALGAAATIDLPSGSHSGGVHLCLRARLGTHAVASQLAREAVRVQAWTNAPVEGTSDGQWAAYDFAPSSRRVTVAKENEFALDAPEQADDDGNELTLTIRLKLRPLAPGTVSAEFAVTYRLTYPDGGVWWLGSQGHDARVLLRRADPWLSAPGEQDVYSGEGEIFRSVGMKEPWGCWAISDGHVEYHPHGHLTPTDAAILVLVPAPSDRTLAQHQPIIVHGAQLSLDAHGLIRCAKGTRARTRVYRAISAERELALALPALGLRWLGVCAGFALVAIPPTNGAARVALIPLLAHAGSDAVVSLDLAACGFDKVEGESAAGFAVFSPLSRRVLGVDGDQIILRVGPFGGTALASAMHALPVVDGVSGREGTWRVAVLTPHELVLSVPEEHAPEVEYSFAPENSTLSGATLHATSHSYDSDLEHDDGPSSQPCPPPELDMPFRRASPPPTHARETSATLATQREHDPSISHRLVAYIVPLLWRTLAVLLRAVLARLFSAVGMRPPRLLMQLLSLSLPGSPSERTPISRAQSYSFVQSPVEEVPGKKPDEASPREINTPTPDRSSTPVREPTPARTSTPAHQRKRALSDATDVTIAPPPRASLKFRVPDGPLSLFALPDETLFTTSDEKINGEELGGRALKDAVRALEAALDGAAIALGPGGGPFARGAAVLEGQVREGKLEVSGHGCSVF